MPKKTYMVFLPAMRRWQCEHCDAIYLTKDAAELCEEGHKKPNCSICDDTGVIETGNNDLPCDCEAGDTALFNGVFGQQTGAEVKEELRLWNQLRKAEGEYYAYIGRSKD